MTKKEMLYVVATDYRYEKLKDVLRELVERLPDAEPKKAFLLYIPLDGGAVIFPPGKWVVKRSWVGTSGRFVDLEEAE